MSELSFHSGDLRATLDGHVKRVRAEILNMAPTNFEIDLEPAAAEQVASRYYINPIELLEDEIYVDATEAQVDVSRDPMRNMFRRAGPLYVVGQRVRYVAPFRGDPTILKCRPSTFSSCPPRARVEGSEIVFEYLVPAEDLPRTKMRFQEEHASLKQHVGWANPDVISYNAQIRSAVTGTWQQRRSEWGSVCKS